MENIYKKTYKGFIIWLVIFVLGITLIGYFLPVLNMSEAAMTRIVDCLALIACTILMYVIYRNEAVYWFTGITFEQAKAAGSPRRKIYAIKHLRLFMIYTVIFCIFSLIMQLIKAPSMIDVVIMVISLLGVCIRTMCYKL